MSLFSAVNAEDMQAARIVTGATMAAYLVVGFVPGLRERAAFARGVLLAAYLVACVAFVAYVLVR